MMTVELFSQDIPEYIQFSPGAEFTYQNSEVPVLELRSGTARVEKVMNLIVHFQEGSLQLTNGTGTFNNRYNSLHTGSAIYLSKNGRKIRLIPGERTPVFQPHLSNRTFSTDLPGYGNIFSDSGSSGTVQIEFE